MKIIRTIKLTSMIELTSDKVNENATDEKKENNDSNDDLDGNRGTAHVPLFKTFG